MDASGGDPPPRSRLHPPGTLAGARRQEQSVTQRFGNPTIGKQRKSEQCADDWITTYADEGEPSRVLLMRALLVA